MTCSCPPPTRAASAEDAFLERDRYVGTVHIAATPSNARMIVDCSGCAAELQADSTPADGDRRADPGRVWIV